MHLESGKSGRFRNFFRDRGKKFWIPIFAIAIAGLGFGIFSAVRAITGSGDSTSISVASNYRGYTYDSNAIYYGLNTSPNYKPWSTRWYNVNGNDAMCLQASRTTPTGSGTAHINTTDVKRIMLATVPSYSKASANAGGPNYYNLFSAQYDWSSKAQSITHLITGSSALSYGGTCNNPASDSRASYSPTCADQEEKTKYADYYYGCTNYYSSSCVKDAAHSLVNMSDAIFAIGHMAASGIYGGDYFALNSSDISIVQGIVSDINAWFSANYPNAVDEYESYTTWVDATHQTVGWLEYKGTPVQPDPTRIRVCKKSTTGTMLQGAVFRFSFGTPTYYTTGADGCTAWIEVDATSIYYTETTAPTGYAIYSAEQTCTVTTENADNTCWAHDNEQVPTAYIKIKKVNSVNSGVSYAGLTVVGTVFSVKNSSNTEVATITIGSDGTGTTNTPLPVGTYTITEKTATAGYNTNSATLTVTLDSSNTASNPTTVDMTGSAFSNTPIYGKISLTKTGYEMTASGSSGTRNLAGITFTAVNKADSSISYTIGPTDSNGAATSPSMVYGTYTVTEVRSNANNAYNLISFEATVSGSSTYSQGAKNDSIPDNPSLSTVARNSNSSATSPDKELEIASNASVTDRITCSGLQNGVQYRLDGEIYEVSSGSKLSSIGTSTFTADASGTCGNLDMIFSAFDTSSYMDKTLGVKQTLYKNNGTSTSPDWVRIFIHNANLADANEKVKVKSIEIKTTANSTRSNNKELAAGIVTVVDTVQVTGLTNGTTYKIRGTLKDASGNTITLYDGSSSKTDTYIMTAATGSTVNIPMNLQLNSSAYIGSNIVVFEAVLSSNDVELAKHESLTDADQTVSVITPTISTIAVNNRDGSSKELEVGTQKVKDTVSYTGLVSGNTYRLEGKLVRVDNGSTIATKNQDFTASGETGTASVTFDLTTAELIGKSLVVYESLYYGNNKIAEHAVSTDADQTVTVKTPTVSTTAVDDADGDKLVEVDDGIKIKDTVTYDGLVQGDEYTLVMKVVRRSNPADVISTGTTTFQASGISGTTTVTSAAFDSTTLHDSNLRGIDLVVYEYLYYGSTLIGSHEDKDDSDQIITVKTPTIKTSAADFQNNTKKLGVGNTAVIDTVTYTDLVPGKPYTISGTLMDKSTGNPATDYHGNSLTATVNFTPTSANGTVNLTFTIFDTTLLFDINASSQKEFVVFEKLYKTSVEIAHHEDLSDADQTVQIATPKIITNATYKLDGGKLLGVGDVTMKDYVDYEGLVEGDWYMIVGTMIDPVTGTAVEIDDEFVRNSKTFKADAGGKGTVALEINLNTISIQGRKFVVYERLYRSNDKHGDGRALAIHEPAVDEDDQTIGVKVAKIETVAKDKADGDNIIDHEKAQQIVDTIDYDGLLMDEEYTLYGFLWDKTNNRPLLDADGKRIEAKTTFTTPTKKDFGQLTMEFPVDAYDLPGVEIVVFEYLFAGDTIPTQDDGTPDTTEVVTKHEDPEDADQTVRVSMRVGTEAVDGYDKDHTIGVGTATITDTMKYEGVTIGKTYKAKGWLVYKKDGNGHKAGDKVQGVKVICEEVPVTPSTDPSDSGEGTDDESGAEDPETEQHCTRTHFDIEGTTTFVAGSEGYAETTGYVVISFTFDSRELVGEEFVVYEELYLVKTDGTEELVAEHKDLNDKGQTVVVAKPEIRTTATDKADGDHELAKNGTVIITDKVIYSGLVPGTTYVLHGELIDKNSGNRLSVDGITEITWEFTPTRDSGSENLEFAIAADNINGKAIVVYEELYVTPSDKADGDKIAEHKDLNDEDQTVWIGPARPNTGLFTNLFGGAVQSNLVFCIAGGIIVSLSGYAIVRRKTRVRRGEINFE